MPEAIDSVTKDLSNSWIWRLQKRLNGPIVWSLSEGDQMATVESAWWSELFTIMSQEEQGGEDSGALQSSLKCLEPIKQGLT